MSYHLDLLWRPHPYLRGAVQSKIIVILCDLSYNFRNYGLPYDQFHRSARYDKRPVCLYRPAVTGRITAASERDQPPHGSHHGSPTTPRRTGTARISLRM